VTEQTVAVGIALQSVQDPGAEARRFEELGYDYVTAGEHVAFNVPAANSFISLAVAAGATSRIRLLNSIALVPLYPAALLAKLGAALDVASGGRFSLGVGIGGEIPREFEACGVPVSERGARTNEALEVITRLWTEDAVDFAGRFNNFSGVTIAPRPRQVPHPPIWVSGRKEAAMRRAAMYGTGWLPYMYTPEMLAGSLQTITSMTDRPVEGGLFIWGCVHEDRATAEQMAIGALSKIYAQDFSRLVGRYAFAGAPDQVVERLGAFAEAGARTIVVSFACPAEHVSTSQRLFADEVLPALRS
jgi:probable F420-dependent oxidoreductase